jgi:hypothetical protein
MKKRLILASLLLVLVALPLLSIAEDDPPSIVDMWIITPNAGQQAEFETAFAAHLQFRTANGDTRHWQTFTMVAGEEMEEYYIRHCCFNWPDQDAYIALEQENGLGDHWMANVNQYVSDYSHVFEHIDWDNSNWPDDAGDFSLVGVTRWTPKPGNTGQRQAAMATFTKTAREHDWDNTWAWSWRDGGPSRLSLAIPYENYADMVPPEQTFFDFMVEHHGEEAAGEVFKNFSSSFWESSYNIYQLRPDLSMGGSED